MSAADTAAAAPPAAPATPAVLPPLRLLYWSVRRELWENRAFWIGPVAIAVVAVAGFLIGAFGLPHAIEAAAVPDTARRGANQISIPYAFVAFAVVITGLVIAFFYCLGALHNERKDRSLLFWKSLPVPDAVAVLAKAALPLVVLPVVQLAVILAAHVVMLAGSALVVGASGAGFAAWWAHVPVLRLWPMLLDGLPFMALWYAPLYAWFLLVSGWARRAPYLWAIAPPLLAGLVERLAFGTSAIWRWIALRLVGVFAGAFGGGHDGAMHAAASWTSPHFWLGLAAAAVFLALAVRLRRRADPI
ncbi:MAG TPA: hypothetical protein VG939_09145 [Caulobacteraceae bacterium]|nr:hypothetical protein [Caulobacteraceae bacterium]